MDDNKKPCLHDTGQGLTVQYKNRYLYSRHDPSKNSLLTVHKTLIQTETLILCFSPLLGYGLEELLQKLPTGTFVLALENDENLMALSVANMSETILKNPAFKYIRTSSIERVLETIDSLEGGPYRRCARIDLSAGISCNPDFYDETLAAVDEYISRFWRNHLTIMKLGRNFARNVFRNVTRLPYSLRIPEQKCEVPIFVAGAGPSLDDTLPFLREYRKSLFILALDTALSSLGDAGITPDAIVLVESQFWIERAFIGFRDSKIPVFADLTARPNAIYATGGPVYFFLSEYMKTRYLSRMRDLKIMPTLIPPLGSVGLVGLYLARMIASVGVPIFVSGLDFSWRSGYTHSRGATPVREILEGVHRFSPPCNPVPEFREGAYVAQGKTGGKIHTDPSLSLYARLCISQFGREHALFDMGTTGIVNGIPGISVKDAQSIIGSKNTYGRDTHEKRTMVEKAQYDAEEIHRYLEAEKKQLRELRDILRGSVIPDNSEVEVKRLVSDSDYLFLHFPDGYRGYSGEPNFLKRVRIELEYFLKTLEKG